MGLFGWKSNKTSIENTEVSNPSKQAESITEIIEQYASKEQPVTEIKGNGIIKDLISAAKTFSEYYFNNINNLDEIKETIRSLQNEMSNLYSINLKNSQNYKELEEKKKNLENFVESQKVFVDRANFTEKILDKTGDVLFISYRDFLLISEKYKYSSPTSIETFTGKVSKQDINALSRVKNLNYFDHYLGKWDSVVKTKDLELATKRPELVDVFHIGDGYGRNSHYTHCELIMVTELFSKSNYERIKIDNQYVIAEISYTYNREKASRNRDSYFSDDSYNYDKNLVYVKDLVKNGVFEIKGLPDNVENIDSFEVKYKELSAMNPLLIQADGYPPIAFFPWCDGIIILRVFGEDEHKLPVSLRTMYTGGEK